MAGDNGNTSSSSSSTAKAGPQPNSENLPPRDQLPVRLQKIVDDADKDETFYEELWDGTAPQSTESSIRYAAYATRIRTALLSAQRYVAYTSDIGESFRPVAHPGYVRAAYGISWAYLVGDVTHEGYKAYCRNQRILHPELLSRTAAAASHGRHSDAQYDAGAAPGAGAAAAAAAGGAAAASSPLTAPGVVPPLENWKTVAVQRAIFQSIASMGLPAFTIHTIVRYSGRALKDSKNVRLRTYGPIGLGLAAVPALPFIFDKPVEEAVEFAFHQGFSLFGGKETVGGAPVIGREKELSPAETTGRSRSRGE